jgi:hypothetical protein
LNVSRALLGGTHALAELGIPVIASNTLLGAADTLAYLGVPLVARYALLRPFAHAHAFLPVPVLEIRAGHLYIAFALTGAWVPNLTVWTQISPWANTSALVEAEVTGLKALNSLLAFASASNWVPVQRRNASQCNRINTPTRIPGHDYDITYIDNEGLIPRQSRDKNAAARATACLDVQN